MEAIVLSPVWKPFWWLVVDWNLLSRRRRTARKACSNLRVSRWWGLHILWIFEWPALCISSDKISNVLCSKCNRRPLPRVCWFPRLCLRPFKLGLRSCRSKRHPHCPCHPDCKHRRRHSPCWTLIENSDWHRLHLEAYVVRRRVDP